MAATLRSVEAEGRSPCTATLLKIHRYKKAHFPPKDVDAYLASVLKELRAILEKLRRAINAAAPRAEIDSSGTRKRASLNSGFL
jgi:hypothetical protein